ncbi:hypothetical protein Ddc_16348 [Ditylenchus destructor]|nr:hypothetical protein Ddc_16348 [Ditylenchus destructor]
MKLIASIIWLFAVILSLFALVPFSEAKPATQELTQSLRASRSFGRQSNVSLRQKRSRSGRKRSRSGRKRSRRGRKRSAHTPIPMGQ